MKNTLIKLGLVLKKEIVFTAALLLAVLSSFFVPVSKEYLGYLDYRVLALLFCLMFLVAGFRKQGVFRYLGRILTGHAGNEMQLEMVLVFLCFFFSMIMTNDVALITFVPFTIEILGSIHKEKHLIPVIVLQTIAANLGSMLTPIGNPPTLIFIRFLHFHLECLSVICCHWWQYPSFFYWRSCFSGDGRSGEPDWILQV